MVLVVLVVVLVVLGVVFLAPVAAVALPLLLAVLKPPPGPPKPLPRTTPVLVISPPGTIIKGLKVQFFGHNSVPGPRICTKLGGFFSQESPGPF